MTRSLFVRHPTRKSQRRRTASKKVLMELMKRRKRGRPPVITEPTACKVCGKVFVVLKDFKAHVVSKVNHAAGIIAL
jgi:hypothetical protein